MDKEWIVECPHDIYDVDNDLEKYLNTNPRPGYTLHQAILRRTSFITDQIYILIWKRIIEDDK